MSRGLAALGGAVVIAHAALFAALATRCRGAELTVELVAPPVSPTRTLDGIVPAALAGRVAITDEPSAAARPGLHHRTWTVRYRGGSERAVGAVQLVGPFQDPAANGCVGRVVVGQRLLDDGAAGPGTIAAAMRREIESMLRAQTIVPVGDFVRIERLALRWAELAYHPEDREMLGAAPQGYVRASASLVFERVTVPVIVALIPEPPAQRALAFRVAARAGLSFDNRALQWLSDTFGIDRLATRLARQQIDDALITALAPPPPFELPGGQTLRFTYCAAPVSIVEGDHGALPFGLALGIHDRDPRVLPPRLGRGPRPPLPAGTALVLDLDLDALNGLLYELWRTGFLDRQLAGAGLDRRFNDDPSVREFLSVRLSPLALTLPPVVSAADAGLRMSAEARIAIDDGGATTTGRVWGSLDFLFAAPGSPAAPVGVTVALGALALSCERAPTTLVPCYSDLVGALRGRTADFHGALTEAFARLVSDIFVGRLGASGVPATLEIRAAAPSLTTTAGNATLRLALDAAISY